MGKKQGKQPPLWVSQNFLTSKKIISRLINLAGITKNDYVIEIGPGKGHITDILLKKCHTLSAIEVDEKLHGKLAVKYADAEKIKLYNQDFLKWKLPESGKYKVFANIPFAITSAIIKKLTQSKNPPQDAWLVMEKGAAKRFCGKPADTLQSLQLKPFFDLNIVYHFRGDDFHPIPGVDVVLLHISQKQQPDILSAEQRLYYSFVSHGIKFGLLGKQALLTKRQVSTALRLAKLNPIGASGEILYIQWLCLFRCWLCYTGNGRKG